MHECEHASQGAGTTMHAVPSVVSVERHAANPSTSIVHGVGVPRQDAAAYTEGATSDPPFRHRPFPRATRV